MDFKTNPASIFVTVILTAIIAGGGVYLWQSQSPSPITPPAETAPVQTQIQVVTQQETIQIAAPYSEPNADLDSSLVMSIKGTIKYGPNYRMDGSVFLVDKNGHPFAVQVEETAKLKGIPETLFDEKIKNVLKDNGETDIWYGLVSDLSKYLKEGQKVTVKGKIDFIGQRILADEIDIDVTTP